MDYLAGQGYEVYALDFLGYGHSDRYPQMESGTVKGKPLGRAMDVYQDVDKAVDYILKKTGRRKVNLIGHSWGGAVAALYAAKFPHKLAKLVLYAAIMARPEENTKYDDLENAFEDRTPKQRIDAMMALTPAGQTNRLAPEILQNWGPEWLASDPLSGSAQSGSVRFPSGPLQDMLRLLQNAADCAPAQISVPTLIVRGEWDTYPNHADATRLLGELVNAPQKRYAVIRKGTHVVHLEESRFELYEEVAQFLSLGAYKAAVGKRPTAVIFEVIPVKGFKKEYLDIAAVLKPELQKIPGFISIERFQSLNDPEKILSLSFWEDEQAIQQWRNLEAHRLAQAKGRGYIFKDYTIRIAQITRNYGMAARKEAPQDSRTFHESAH